MTTPIGPHIRKAFEAMWYTMIELFFIGICFRVGLADALCDNLAKAFLMTRILAIFTLHTCRVFEKITA